MDENKSDYFKYYKPSDPRDCVAGDIVGVVGDAIYPAMIIRKSEDAYEGIILERLDGKTPESASCKPGQMFIMKDEQIVTRLYQIPLTVTQNGEEDQLDFDEGKLKELGFELPQL